MAKIDEFKRVLEFYGFELNFVNEDYSDAPTLAHPASYEKYDGRSRGYAAEIPIYFDEKSIDVIALELSTTVDFENPCAIAELMNFFVDVYTGA